MASRHLVVEARLPAWIPLTQMNRCPFSRESTTRDLSTKVRVRELHVRIPLTSWLVKVNEPIASTVKVTLPWPSKKPLALPMTHKVMLRETGRGSVLHESSRVRRFLLNCLQQTVSISFARAHRKVFVVDRGTRRQRIS